MSNQPTVRYGQIVHPKAVVRLEGQHHKTKDWAPSISYKQSMRDIEEQYTPAENYRNKLLTTGKEARILQRLEWKWQRDLERWTKAATTVKAGYRGMLGRRKFQAMKEDLVIKFEQRTCKANVLELMIDEQFEPALHEFEAVSVMTIELYIMKLKIFYVKEDMKSCISESLRVLGTYYVSLFALYQLFM